MKHVLLSDDGVEQLRKREMLKYALDVPPRSGGDKGNVILALERAENIDEGTVQLGGLQAVRVELDLPLMYGLGKLRTAADEGGEKIAVALAVAAIGVVLRREVNAALVEGALVGLEVRVHREHKSVVEIDHGKLSFFQSGCRHRLRPLRAPHRTSGHAGRPFSACTASDAANAQARDKICF